MITILHGDDSTASRQVRYELIQEAKSKHNEIVYLEGKGLELEQIIGACEAGSLFSKEKLVVIDNLISSLRTGKKRDQIIEYLVKANFDVDVVLWEPKGVGRSIIKLKKPSHVSVQECKLPTTIFSFVDSLGMSNPRQSLGYLDKALETTPIEVVFAMIVRQYRLMLGLIFNSSISETKRLAPWQRGKLVKQAQTVGEDSLIAQYKHLLTIDYLTKTGRSSLDLTKHTQAFIITV